MAKLVEILARELKEWPEGAESAVQDSDGEVKFSRSANLPRMNSIKTVWMRHEDAGGESLWIGARAADDYTTAIVTRAEWQAAVDALKPDAQRFAEDYVEANKDRHAKEWDGSGLPPVGLPVEWCSDNSVGWQEIVVLAYYRFDAWIQPKGKASMIVGNIDNFRPIRTPEQIAEDVREAGIAEIRQTLASSAKGSIESVIWDAGYRKQEPK